MDNIITQILDKEINTHRIQNSVLFSSISEFGLKLTASKAQSSVNLCQIAKHLESVFRSYV